MMNRRNLIQLIGALIVTPVVAKAKPKQPTLLLQQSPIAGFQYYDGEQLWDQFQLNQPLTLQREADNPHDKRAVAIYWRHQKLGYIPRRDNTAISQLIDRGQTLQVSIQQLNDTDNVWKRMQIAVMVSR
jgi:hypothetical protein